MLQLRISSSGWRKRGTDIFLYPFILRVPDAVKVLKGREKTNGLSRFAREGARMSAEKSALDISGFKKNSKGGPVESKGVFWSVSHKPDIVAGVVSRERIGIDIEIIRPVSDRLFNRVISADERLLLKHESRELAFFRTFTAKEAVLKQTGDGIKGLSEAKVSRVLDNLNLYVNYQGQDYLVENFIGDRYLASVTKKTDTVHWTVM